MRAHFKLSKPDTQPNKATRPGFNQTQDYSNYPGDYSMSGAFGFKNQGKYDLAKAYDKHFQLQNNPSSSKQAMPGEKIKLGSEKDPLRQTAAAGAVVKGASKSSASGKSSNQSTNQVREGTGVLGRLLGAGVGNANNRMNIRNQSNASENFFNNQLGQGPHVNSPHFHAAHHSDKAFNAQTQTIREQQNIQQSWSNVLGPIGGVIGHLRSRNHVSDLERNLNFKTATDTRGNAINPADSRNNNAQSDKQNQIKSGWSNSSKNQQGENIQMQEFSKPPNATNQTEETSFTNNIHKPAQSTNSQKENIGMKDYSKPQSNQESQVQETNVDSTPQKTETTQDIF